MATFINKKLTISLLAIGAVFWVLLAYISQPLIIGKEIPDIVLLSDTKTIFTFKFLCTFLFIGAIGGFFASRFKHNNTLRTLIHLSSTLAVFLYIYAIYTIYG